MDLKKRTAVRLIQSGLISGWLQAPAVIKVLEQPFYA
jgi:hypothetical protein